QARLAEQTRALSTKRASSQALLLGKLRDERGNLFSPTYAMKGGRRYRYYVSRAVQRGRPDEGGSVGRVPANEIETMVIEAVRERFAEGASSMAPNAGLPASDHDRHAIRDLIERVTIAKDRIEIVLVTEPDDDEPSAPIILPWTAPLSTRKREILLPESEVRARPMRAEARDRLLRSMARARSWLADLLSGKVTDIDEIAQSEGKSERSVRMLLPLAFVAPDVVKAAVDGRLPRGCGLSRMADLPLDWIEQRRMIGMPAAGF
ncbi:MAG: recombinase family protein, partial [Verrucomicrobia bacterium]|nr:recombinase family protein [Verrucomicrobiota bacterium]